VIVGYEDWAVVSFARTDITEKLQRLLNLGSPGQVVLAEVTAMAFTS